MATSSCVYRSVISSNSVTLLNKRYLEPNESIDGMFKRVSDGDDDFYRIMVGLDFMPNSPTLMNAGTGRRGTLSACFRFDVEDSMIDGPDSIMETATKAASVAKWGGGVGYALSNLRPKNAPIQSVHRKACGPVGVLRFYNQIGNLVTQGGKRHLAQMGILGCWHDDILEFIHCKDQDPQALATFNISVAATDKFMEESKIPGTKAYELWTDICNSAWKTGDPGLYFIDVAERGNPTPWLGRLEGTNPCGEVPLLNNEACLDGSTLIETKEGLLPIGSLVGRTDVSVYTHDQSLINGCEVIYKGVRKTLKFKLNSGQTLQCTPDHKILTDRGWMEAGQLQIGSRVRVADLPIVMAERQPQLEDEMLGWFLGDGWMTSERSCGILFAKDDQEAMDVLMPVWDTFVDFDYALQTQPTGVRQKSCEKLGTIKKFLDMGFPIGNALKKGLPTYLFKANASRQIAFLRGLFSADGGVKKSGCGKRNIINLASSSRKLLEQVQVMLMRFGIQSNLVWTRFNNSTRNDQGNLRIAGKSALAYLDKIGFNLSVKQNCFEYGERPNNNHAYFKVTQIAEAAETEVYDVRMPEKHYFIANGMVVHNCNLGSINLGNFVTANGEVDWNRLEETTVIATRFLDNILDRNSFPHPLITAAVAKTRKLGLGIMGWADMLALLHIHYDTNEAVELGRKIMLHIQDVAHHTSCALGLEKGPYPASHGDRRRNSTLTCIAPTGSISIIAGASSGIEPHYDIEWERTMGDGTKLQERIPVYEHLDGWRPKTAMEIDVEWHIRHQAAFQQGTDLACSKTINMPNSASVEDIDRAYRMMHELGCKGGTIFRDGCRGEQVLVSKKEEKNVFSTNGHNRIVGSVNGNGHAKIVATEVPAGASVAAIKEEVAKISKERCRERLPDERQSLTHKFSINGIEGYATIGLYDDGRPGEIFICIAKEGSTVSGLLDAWATSLSMLMQYGCPLESLVKKFAGTRFEPCGMTKNKELPMTTSPIDYIIRYLDMKFGSGIKKVKIQHSGMHCPDCGNSAIFEGGCLSCSDKGCGWSRCG